MNVKLKELWQKTYLHLGREKLVVMASVGLVIGASLWINFNAAPKETPDEEIGVSIPQGQLVVPLELANANALSALITKTAVIDVFQSGNPKALVENLRILKLAASGEGPLFGALVPVKIAGTLQDLFSRPKLRGAIRTTQAGPTTFYLKATVKPLLLEVSTGDEL